MYKIAIRFSFFCLTAIALVGGYYCVLQNRRETMVFYEPSLRKVADDGDLGTIVLFAREVNAQGKGTFGEVLILRFENEMLSWRHVDRYGMVFIGEFAFSEKDGLENFRQLEQSSFGKTGELQADNYYQERVKAYELLGIPKPHTLELYIGSRYRLLESWQDVNQLVAHQSFRKVYEGLRHSPIDKQGSLIFDDTISMIYGFQRNIRKFK